MSDYKNIFEFFLLSVSDWSMKYEKIQRYLFLCYYKIFFEFFYWLSQVGPWNKQKKKISILG